MFKKNIFIAIAIVFASVVTLAIPPMVSASAHENREAQGLELTAGFLEEPAYENVPNAAFLRINRPDDHRDDEALLYEEGALFNAVIQPEESFVYTVPEVADDLEVLFHADGIDADTEGRIKIEPSGHGENARVDITVEGFTPSELTVSEGAEITFHNTAEQSVTIRNNPVLEAHNSEKVSPENMDIHTMLEVEITHIPTGENVILRMQPSVNGVANEFIAPFIPTALGAYQFRFFGEVEGEPVDETFKGGPSTFDEVISPRTIQFPFEVASTRELGNATAGAREIAEDARSEAQSLSTITWASFAIGIVGLIAGISSIIVAIYRARRLKV